MISTKRMRAFAISALVIGALSFHVKGFRQFQSRIPNGGLVPHPCRPNDVWQAVGHINAEGGAARNVFGQDFYRNGMKWDRCLCERDSDGDGRTNGEELGDPECQWVEGTAPTLAPKDKLSHPGICEPLNSTQCQESNDWNVCDQTSPSSFKSLCPAVKQSGVLDKVLQFPMVSIPAKRSIYKCMSFEVPTEQDYHIIGAQPLIKNPDLVHHMVVIGCQNPENLPDTPVDCETLANKCEGRTWLMIWRLGSPGYCAGPEFGFKIGQNGFKRVILGIHWKNSEAQANLKDDSGLQIFYTPNMRSNDAAMLSIGISAYELPNGVDKLDVKAKCSKMCTNNLKQDIKLADGILHKYYLGAPPAILSTIQGGTKTALITSTKYQYDIVKVFDAPVNFASGAELETTGEIKADAHAYSLVTYYPASDLKFCMQYRNIDVCAFPDKQNMQNKIFGNCSLVEFFQNYGNIKTELSAVCSINCTNACYEKINAVKQANSNCLVGDEGLFLEIFILGTSTEGDKEIFKLLKTCEVGNGEEGGDLGQGSGFEVGGSQTTPPVSDSNDDTRQCIFTKTSSGVTLQKYQLSLLIFCFLVFDFISKT